MSRPSDSHLLLTRPTELQLLGRPRVYGKRRCSTALPNLCWAVVAVLANADEPVSRDALLLLLWPDSTVPRARAALSQALYLLRRNLGPDAIAAEGDWISLNNAVIGSDIGCFRYHVRKAEWRPALAEYRGDFLTDVTVRRVPEFEAWVGARRAEYDAMRRRCLRELIDESLRLGHRADAIEFLTTMTALYPADSLAEAELRALRPSRSIAVVDLPVIRSRAPLVHWLTGAAAGLLLGFLAGSWVGKQPPAVHPPLVVSSPIADSHAVSTVAHVRMHRAQIAPSRPVAIEDVLGGGGAMEVPDCQAIVTAFCDAEPVRFYRTKPPEW